jgi:IS605 OrfB family transposase
VIKDNKIELHHCVKTKEKKIWQEENIVGIDKGYRHLLATSSGHLYGDGLNDLLSKETERLNKINQKRNKIWAQMEQCKKDGDFKKAERIFKNNFGKKKYNKHKNQHSATVKSYINYSLNQFFYLDKPSEVVQEDLSFVSWKNAFPKHIKRKLSRWIKGYIKQRINYKCDLWNVTYTFVNPAYTSKICNKCHHFGKRTGDVFACEHCGKEHSDNNAAKNILHRKYDAEITLYTPYKKVKEILEKRIKAKLKTS